MATLLPKNGWSRLSQWLASPRASGTRWELRRDSGFYYVLGALLLAVPLWWRSRAAWFSLVFTAVAWTWMALTHDAGASAHHVVLLWPFPILSAIAAVQKLPKFAIALFGTAMVGSNLLIVNQYLYQLQRNGAFSHIHRRDPAVV